MSLRSWQSGPRKLLEQNQEVQERQQDSGGLCGRDTDGEPADRDSARRWSFPLGQKPFCEVGSAGCWALLFFILRHERDVTTRPSNKQRTRVGTEAKPFITSSPLFAQCSAVFALVMLLLARSSGWLYCRRLAD